MRIKICGITNIVDALVAAEYGADAVGFILFSGSKRYIDPENVKKIVKELPAFMTKVGVFVNETTENVNFIMESAGLNIAQLHGKESYDFINEIKSPVIKAISVTDEFDYTQLDAFPDCTFLLDAFHPELKGGTGLSFNWDSIPTSIRDKIILAGGISADNIEYIFKTIKPEAIDLSSSVEVSPGIKDHTKLKQLLNKLNELRYR